MLVEGALAQGFATSAPTRLFLPEARAARYAARRRGDRALEAAAPAGAKKTPQPEDKPSSS